MDGPGEPGGALTLATHLAFYTAVTLVLAPGPVGHAPSSLPTTSRLSWLGAGAMATLGLALSVE